MTDVAVVILTFNEELNLPAALDSVKGWAAEVFVVDSFSTDRTVDIALARAQDNVRVVQHAFVDYSAQWNWALAALPIKSGWTLKLDADERVTPEFKEEARRVFAGSAAELDGIYFRRRITVLGRALRWGGAQSNYDLRLWRTGRASFEKRAVNEHVLVQGRTARLRAIVEHHDYKSIAEWIEKHNRYSSLEAIALAAGNVTGGVNPRLFGRPDERRMWLRAVYRKLPLRPLVYFSYRYVFRLGFLDGRAGFRFCFLYAAFLYWIDLKLDEMRRTGKPPAVVWPARGAPHPGVASTELQHAVDPAPTLRPVNVKGPM